MLLNLFINPFILTNQRTKKFSIYRLKSRRVNSQLPIAIKLSLVALGNSVFTLNCKYVYCDCVS